MTHRAVTRTGRHHLEGAALPVAGAVPPGVGSPGQIPGVVSEAHLVILPGAIWRAELEAELVRLGVSAERAPISAGHVLHRVVAHYGWQRDHFQVADGDSPEPKDVELL